MNLLKTFFILTIFLEGIMYCAEPASAASSSDVKMANTQEKLSKKRKERDEEQKPATNIFLVNRALLIGKVQVIKNELKKLAYMSNNKFIRNFLGTLIEDAEKFGVSNNEELFEQLNVIVNKLNEIKSIRGITENDISKINEVQEKINSVQAIYIKNIDLSHFRKKDEEEQKMQDEENHLKETLNLSDSEAFTQESFIDLITRQQKKNLPYVLARVETMYGIHYFDAHSLNNYMFDKYPIYPAQGKWGIRDNFVLHKKGNDQGFMIVEDILNRSPLIIDKINYFTINSLKDSEFKYLSSFNELITDKKIQKYFYYNYDYLYTPDKVFTIAQDKEIDISLDFIKWLPDGTKIAFTANSKITILDINTGQIIRKINSKDKQIRFDFSPDSSQIVFTNGDSIDVMDIYNGNLIKSISPYLPEDYVGRNRNQIHSIFYLPGIDPKVITKFHNSIRAWSLNTKELKVIIYNHSVFSPKVAISDDYSKIAFFVKRDANYMVQSEILILDSNQLQNILKEIKVDTLSYHEIIFSPDNSRISTVDVGLDMNNYFGKPFCEQVNIIKLITRDYETGRIIKDLKINIKDFYIMNFSTDASKISSVSKIFDANNGKEIGNLLSKSYLQAWSKDSSKFAGIVYDEQRKKYNLEIYEI
ncbi:MAG: hypothetical protein P4L22_04785 [Candidatus Babeliales bacterium]|nr:hypothetical protein [Candidatus Babeliales bacterium]